MASIDWDAVPEIKQRTFRYFVHGLRTLWTLLGDERGPMKIALALLVVTRTLDFTLPLVFKRLFTILPEAQRTGSTSAGDKLLLFGFMLGLVNMAIHHYAKEPLFWRSIVRLEGRWPMLAQRKLLNLHLPYHERENTGKKIAKVNKGTTHLVNMMCELWWGILPSVTFLAVNALIVVVTDWRLALPLFLPLVPAILCFMSGQKRFRPIWERCEVQREEASGVFCQSVLNVRTVQAYVQESRELQRTETVRERVIVADTNACIGIQRYGHIVNACSYTGLLLAIWIGFHETVRGTMDMGTVSFVFVTGFTMMHVLWDILHTYTKVVKDIVSAERMHALLMEPEEVRNAPHAIVPLACDGMFRFDRVSFRYSERNECVLSGVSLSIGPGEMLALVGRSGAGKTTVVHLLARAYDVTGGVIRLDGTDIRDIDRDWYRRLFAFVHQNVEIFDGTIRENIAYACPEATQEDVARAVEASFLTATLADTDTFPDGLETKVGERGVRLSGGEAQRVGIARAYLAILRGARVLVLDEATSSLDSESELAVQSFLRRLRDERNTTIIAIAHRLATIRSADRILVIDDGRLVEEGDHEELLLQNGLYSRLVTLQGLGEVRD